MDATNSSMPAIPAVPPQDPDDEPTNPGICRCSGCDERRSLELALDRADVDLATLVRRRTRQPSTRPTWRAALASAARGVTGTGHGETEGTAIRNALTDMESR